MGSNHSRPASRIDTRVARPRVVPVGVIGPIVVPERADTAIGGGICEGQVDAIGAVVALSPELGDHRVESRDGSSGNLYLGNARLAVLASFLHEAQITDCPGLLGTRLEDLVRLNGQTAQLRDKQGV